ncbi:MAG: hypothetical protein HY898_05210 [Deltaproteobacteria bacterium]|nr:hypothetical protein [Deltaproteobacteria bacterium]
MVGWFRRNWWMFFAVLAGPALAILSLLLVRWLRIADEQPRELPEEGES